MKNFEMIHRMRRMDKLISIKATGTPKEFAKRIDLSVSRLYDILIDMKDLGAPIKYSRIMRSYLYKEHGELTIDIEWKNKKN
jgi:hypothetical protein